MKAIHKLIASDTFNQIIDELITCDDNLSEKEHKAADEFRKLLTAYFIRMSDHEFLCCVRDGLTIKQVQDMLVMKQASESQDLEETIVPKNAVFADGGQVPLNWFD